MTETTEKKMANLLGLRWKDEPLYGFHGSDKGELVGNGRWYQGNTVFTSYDFERWENIALVYQKLGMKIMPSSKQWAINKLEKMMS